MNRIVLIGNGFDLAHGLKTSYADFIRDLWMGKIKEFVERRDGVFDDTFKDSEGYIEIRGGVNLNEQVRTGNFFNNNTMPSTHSAEQLNNTRSRVDAKISQWEEEKKGWFLDKFKAILKECDVVMDCNNKFLAIISKGMEKNWVDIEEDYYKQLVSLIDKEIPQEEKVYKDIEELHKDFERIKKALEEYLKRVVNQDVIFDENIEYNIYNGIGFEEITNIGMNNIRKRVEDMIPEIDKEAMDEEGIYYNSKEQREEIRPREILFLNFNYSSIAQYMNGKRKSEVLHIHIHGELNNPDNPIIFGYGDELDDKYSSIEKINDNRFLENVKSIRYLETDNYKRLLNFVDSDLYQICVFGHSCGISDRTLLNTLFEHKNCVSIKVFYHQKEDGTDNYSDVVRNISRNFTDKAAMREKVVNKTYCSLLKGKSQQE